MELGRSVDGVDPETPPFVGFAPFAFPESGTSPLGAGLLTLDGVQFLEGGL